AGRAQRRREHLLRRPAPVLRLLPRRLALPAQSNLQPWLELCLSGDSVRREATRVELDLQRAGLDHVRSPESAEEELCAARRLRLLAELHRGLARSLVRRAGQDLDPRRLLDGV